VAIIDDQLVAIIDKKILAIKNSSNCCRLFWYILQYGCNHNPKHKNVKKWILGYDLKLLSFLSIEH
jgi:hypothetical protein